MYGYIRPVKPELKIREYELYRQCYCGLCHALRLRGGTAARFIVNYDFTFLSMLLSAGCRAELCKTACPTRLFGKRTCTAADNAAMAAADESIILAYWKLKDGIQDSSFFSGLKYRLALLPLRRCYRKAAAAMPQFEKQTAALLSQLRELELSRCAGIDEPADKFARILRAAAEGEQNPRRRRVLEQLLYHTGRMIYILDAIDDLADDFRTGSYNPLIFRFSLDSSKLSEEQKQQLRETLSQSQHDMAAAFALLDKNLYHDILSNIIYYGIPWKTEAVLSGTEQKKERRLFHE